MPISPTATRTRPPHLPLPTSLLNYGGWLTPRYTGSLRVLLVDDDSAVLSGMRRLLRACGFGEWDIELATGAATAMGRLEARPFDVVVCDMRMPVVDGALLLREIGERYPLVGRVVLSGHTDPETVRRSLRVAHRFLAKPCNPDALITAIRDAAAAACRPSPAADDPPGSPRA